MFLFAHHSQSSDQSPIHFLDPIFVGGFKETLLTKGDRVFSLTEHLERANSTLVELNSTSVIVIDEWREAILAFVKKHRIQTDYGRLNIFFSIKWSTEPAPVAGLLLQTYEKPLAPFLAVTCKDPNFEESNIPSIKWIKSKRNELCLNHAIRNKKNLGVFVDREGYLLEAHHSNIFYGYGGNIYTPPLGQILPGITRQQLLSRNLQIRERKLHREELDKVEALWASNSLIGLHPIAEIDNRPVGIASLSLPL